jgi:hypothetical protein
MASVAAQSGRPRFDEIELHILSDALKIPVVISHEDATSFTTRQRKQDVIRERFRKAGALQSLFSRHVELTVSQSLKFSVLNF